MKFGLKNLKEEILYTVIDVDLISRRHDKKSDELRLILFYEEDGMPTLMERYVNVQFGVLLRTALRIKGDSMILDSKIVLTELPIDFANGPRDLKYTNTYLAEEYLYHGTYRFPKKPTTVHYGQMISVYRSDSNFVVAGKEVKFITVPNYEVVRFFTFGVNKYNELLLKGEFFANDSSNKLYNPEFTREYREEDGKRFKFVQLRNKIPNSCVQLAGDIAFVPPIRSIAMKVSSLLPPLVITPEASTNLDKVDIRGVFSGFMFPRLNYTEIYSYGRFVHNKSGELGFEVLSFADAKYGEKYSFRRDNDGRSTPQRKNTMKKIFGGKKKSKAKKDKLNKNITQDAVSDSGMECVNQNEFIDKYDYKPRDLSGVQVPKTTQEFIADKKTPSDDVDGKGYAPDSTSGESGSGYAPVDNDTIIGPDDITDSKYWTMFPVIIEELSKLLIDYDVRVSYFTKDYVFTGSPGISNFENIEGISDQTEFYLVRITFGQNYVYIIELNSQIYDLPTMVFWEGLKQEQLSKEKIGCFLLGYHENGGVPETVRDDVSVKFPVEYTKVKHQYVKPGTEGKIRYNDIVAIENQARKMYNAILNVLG